MKTIVSDKEWEYRKKNQLPFRNFERLSDFKKKFLLTNPDFCLLKKTLAEELEDKNTVGEKFFPVRTKLPLAVSKEIGENVFIPERKGKL